MMEWFRNTECGPAHCCYAGKFRRAEELMDRDSLTRATTKMAQNLTKPGGPIRLLHLVNSLGRGGGVEKWLMSMLQTVSPEVCRMDFACKGAARGDMAADAERLGATVYQTPLGLFHIGFARGLAKVLKNGKYDLVHNHLNAFSGFPVWVVRRNGIPVITTFHSTRLGPEDQRLLFPGLKQLRSAYEVLSVGYAIRNSDLVTGVSRAVVDAHVYNPGKLTLKPEVLYLGVELPEPASADQRADFRRSLECPAQTPLVLHVGTFKHAKNHATIVRVFEHVLKTLPRAKLLLVGVGPLQSEIEGMVARSNMEHAVRFLGLREDVSAIMTCCDVLLLPSIFEGFPLVALEANAAWLPVVGSRIPQIQEAVQDGETALLHDPHDMTGMAESVIELLEDKEYAEKLGRAGRLRVETHFSTLSSAKRLLDLYDKCLSIYRCRASNCI
jgi:glycosyltransferase involved in cell wall biosynthesis